MREVDDGRQSKGKNQRGGDDTSRSGIRQGAHEVRQGRRIVNENDAANPVDLVLNIAGT